MQIGLAHVVAVAGRETTEIKSGETKKSDSDLPLQVVNITPSFPAVICPVLPVPRGSHWKHSLTPNVLAVTLSRFPVSRLFYPTSSSQIPVDRTELVPVSLELGFELHHAEKEYVMLNM